MIKEANDLNHSLNNAKFILAHADNLPFDNNIFDKVFTVNTIYFWENAQQILNEIRRILKPGGLFVVTLRPRYVMDQLPVVKHGFTTYTGQEVADLKDAFGLKNISWYNNLSWKENFGKGWKMNLGAGYSTNNDDITQELQNAENVKQTPGDSSWSANKNFVIDNRSDLSQIKLVLEKRLFGISAIRFGGEYMHGLNKSSFNDFHTKLIENFTSLFAETDIYVTNDIAAKAGGRYEYSSIIGKANFAPRLSFAYKTGKGAQVSAAYGIFYQKPENNQLIYTTDLGYTKATHYILTYQKTTNERIFRVETFYKDYDALVKNYEVNSSFNNNGLGFAKGIEFFWRDRKSIKNFDYWISYSFLDTKRDYLNFPYELQPNFAAKHTTSLVTKRFFMDIKTGFNFTYSFATGRPYYRIAFNEAQNKFGITDQGTTKQFHSLGFSMNYVPSIGKPNAKTFWVLVASVTNELGTKRNNLLTAL